jgi:hypothetical protein
MQFITLFSGADCATCALSFVSAHEALGGVRIIAVDDGTVSEAQAQEMRRKTGEWLEIIPAKKAYEVLTDKTYLTSRVDRLLQSRRVMQKLFQVDAIAEGNYFYFDSDVVFLRKVDVPAMESELESCDAIISANPRFCAYCFSAFEVGAIRRSLYRLNSGVFAQRAEVATRDTANLMLGGATDGYLRRTWVEQSTRAQIYGKYRCQVFSDRAAGDPIANGTLGDQPHAAHFMGGTRGMMSNWTAASVLEQIRSSAPVRWPAGPARRNSVRLYYADRIRRHLFNRYAIEIPASPTS